MPVTKAAVALKKLSSKLKERYQNKQWIRLRQFPPCCISLLEIKVTFIQKHREKEFLICVSHCDTLKNLMLTVHQLFDEPVMKKMRQDLSHSLESKSSSSSVSFFFYLGFLSWTFTIHRAAGEGGGYLFNSSLTVSPASQTLRC